MRLRRGLPRSRKRRVEGDYQWGSEGGGLAEVCTGRIPPYLIIGVMRNGIPIHGWYGICYEVVI